jgi:hypothetical protein
MKFLDMSLSMSKSFWGYIKKKEKKKKREEKVRRERDRKGQVSYLASRAYLPKKLNFEMNNGHVSEGE